MASGKNTVVVVHHKNGDRRDNSPANLELVEARRSSVAAAMQCEKCGGPIDQGCVRSLVPPTQCDLCLLTERSEVVAELVEMARSLED